MRADWAALDPSTPYPTSAPHEHLPLWVTVRAVPKAFAGDCL